MNDQTTKLIEQLAEKLGTTTEYLWSVLVNQAPISAIVDIVYIAISVVSVIFIYFLHKKFSKVKDDCGQSIYSQDDGVLIPVMFFVTVIWGIIFITCFFSIDDIVTGLLNPEYWALKEILNTVD